MAGLCEGGNEPPSSLKANATQVTCLIDRCAVSLAAGCTASLPRAACLLRKQLPCRLGSDSFPRGTESSDKVRTSVKRDLPENVKRSMIADALRSKNLDVHEDVHCIADDGSSRRIDIIAINRNKQAAKIIDPMFRFEISATQPSEVNEEKKKISESTIQCGLEDRWRMVGYIENGWIKDRWMMVGWIDRGWLDAWMDGGWRMVGEWMMDGGWMDRWMKDGWVDG
ncbi:hypothetical protein ANN_16938 [Periplaneta americana]|uniref:Uncharacterized protein n=1 Tax=Periplaneta americana TaxID=6978 RepID=A0ABQ8SSQ8_PERAM|nr:hypothetical protein ANN_16938 [Periplaneta americana]